MYEQGKWAKVFPAGWRGGCCYSTDSPLISIKQPKQMIKLAALSLCSEKPERMPTFSCSPPLGGGYSPQTPTKQPTKQNPKKPLHHASPLSPFSNNSKNLSSFCPHPIVTPNFVTLLPSLLRGEVSGRMWWSLGLAAQTHSSGEGQSPPHFPCIKLLPTCPAG